jgi:predicted permease
MGSRYVPVPRLEDVQLDWSVLIFAAIVSMMTAIIFGLVPVQELSRLGIRDALNQAGSRGHVGVGSSRMRNILVVTQIALSFVLAINAGLLMRSFFVLTNVPLGFRSDHVLVAYAHAPAEGSIFKQSGLENYLRVGRELDDLVARIEHLPGVVSAGAVMGLPTGQYNSDGSYVVEGKNSFSGDPRVLPHAGFRLSGPGYFTTMRIPLLRGRDFDGTDIYGRQPVAIISAALARQSFGDEDPIGHKVMWGFDLPIQWATIVGIVGDVRQASPAASIEAQLYMPLRQHPYAANEIQIVLRSGRTPELLIPDIRETARAVNPSIATKFIAMEDSVAESIAAPRFRMTLVGAFASIALLLAATGMYAVLSCTTTQRIPEFAVRRALGAQARTIVGLVLRQAARLSAIGVMIGLVLVLATHRVIAAMLFGIDTSDIATYAGVLLATLPIVMIAAALPALRAARVDPAATLRMD